MISEEAQPDVPNGSSRIESLSKTGGDLVTRLLNQGIDGLGPLKSAQHVADEARTKCHGDIDKAISRVIAMHTRNVAVSGFATGFGGFTTMVATVPADVMMFYSQATRMVAAIAHLRGYHIDSEEVRSIVGVSILGSAGARVLNQLGVNVAEKAAVAALKKMPGKIFIEINKKVGFRLLTKFGEKGAINLVKAIPVVASGVGAALNAGSMRTIASYAKRNFPEFDAEASAD